MAPLASEIVSALTTAFPFFSYGFLSFFKMSFLFFTGEEHQMVFSRIHFIE